MKTILLEGVESSGKTTIAELVSHRLKQEGYGVVWNTGPISKSSIMVNMPLEMAHRIKVPSFQEIMYTVSLMADGRPEEQHECDFFIQERYFPSVVAYSLVFNRFGINRHFGKQLRRVYGEFDYNFLIKADTNSRVYRLRQRENKTKLDKMVELNPELSVNLEMAFRQILSREKNYAEIDTSNITPDQAAAEVIGRIR